MTMRSDIGIRMAGGGTIPARTPDPAAPGRREPLLRPEETLRVFSACPPVLACNPARYAHQLRELARASEEAGCEGMLVYADGQADPWFAAHIITNATRRLCPLVSVQPYYLHPFSAARMIASFGLFYGRRLYLNLVAGGADCGLEALGDTKSPEVRHARLMEYALILRMLLRSAGPVTYEGKHYRITGRGLKRRLPASLMPRLMVSGSYEAGRIAARRLGATPIECPRPPAACEALPQFEADAGMRIGIVCRAHDEEAWSAALPRLAAPASASLQLERPPAGLPQLHSAAAGAARAPVRDCYWAAPFESGRARCPYLVGSYDRVAAALACYARTGHRTVILDLVSAEEIRHIGAALARARRFAATG